ncbi:MAG: class I adenylate-forming enzyme family protein [Actinomycetota bacterium]
MIDHYRAARAELEAPGMPFHMSTVEVRGVPVRVFDSAPPTMRMLWEASAAHADQQYICYEDEHYTYAQAHVQVRKLAQHLVAQGVKPGDRVALAMRNYPEWIIGYWASVCVGAACVGMNAWWTPHEMEYALDDSHPKVLIADDERLERVSHILEAVRVRLPHPLHVVSVRSDRPLPTNATTWSDIMAIDDPGTLPNVDIDPDDDATIFYTSGTTGFPKGAQLTHRGSVHNLLNIVYMGAAVASAEAKAVAAGDLPAPTSAPAAPSPLVFMAPTPLFHVTACNCVLHPATASGAKIVLTYKWDAGRALELIERERVTNFSGVPTMGRELLMHPDWATRDTSTLLGISGGGSAVQPDLVHKIDNALEKGVPTTGYGMTETHGIITANSSRFYTAKPASCGPVVPTLDYKLVDEEGHDLPLGPETTGVMCVRGSVVIKGYINRPEATADSIVDGWLNTGDIARIDEDGWVFIVDRAKDMVIRGGENVYCSEVEAAIYHHEAVAEAIVFGVPDDRLGEAVAAVVVPVEGATITAEELTAFLKTDLSAYKIPSQIWVRTDLLPRNASGKFLKREVRKEILGG